MLLDAAAPPVTSARAVANQLAAAGAELSKKLLEMLDEDPAHHTERRGCGFTQSTRVLAQALHEPGAPERLFARGLPDADRVRGVAETFPGLRRRWVQLLADVIDRQGRAPVRLRGFEGTHEVGTCALAEKYFLEVAHGLIPRRGWVRVFVDESGRPALLEKSGMGEAYSALGLVDLEIDGVVAAPGSLFAVRHTLASDPRARGEGPYRVAPLSAVQGRLLRFTTLSATADERQALFGPQLERQHRASYVRADRTELADVVARAEEAVARS